MTTLREAISVALTAHQPKGKDYRHMVKLCQCGHEAPIGDMGTRTRHLIDMASRAADEWFVERDRRRRSGVHLGYVVIEWNQASHRPDVLDGSLTDDLGVAEEIAAGERARTAEVGRRERYDVATVQLIEEVDD